MKKDKRLNLRVSEDDLSVLGDCIARVNLLDSKIKNNASVTVMIAMRKFMEKGGKYSFRLTDVEDKKFDALGDYLVEKGYIEENSPTLIIRYCLSYTNAKLRP